MHLLFPFMSRYIWLEVVIGQVQLGNWWGQLHKLLLRSKGIGNRWHIRGSTGSMCRNTWPSIVEPFLVGRRPRLSPEKESSVPKWYSSWVMYGFIVPLINCKQWCLNFFSCCVSGIQTSEFAWFQAQVIFSNVSAASKLLIS